jgi:hypothetical protein
MVISTINICVLLVKYIMTYGCNADHKTHIGIGFAQFLPKESANKPHLDFYAQTKYWP